MSVTDAPLGVTDTLSKTASFTVVGSWLVAARPAEIAVPPGDRSAVVEPTIVQVPLFRTKPVYWLPFFVSFKHAGNGVTPPAMKLVSPLATGRDMNSTPPSGLTSRITSGSPPPTSPPRLPRIITPALAKGLIPLSDTMRATISTSPLKNCDTYWNESNLPQMSEPRASR